jgi:hypothetical protein
MEGSIKELQESTNHLVEWFPICVDVFFFLSFFCTRWTNRKYLHRFAWLLSGMDTKTFFACNTLG